MLFRRKTLTEKILAERPAFENWARGTFPLISRVLGFDEKSMSYTDDTVNHMWVGWLGAKGLS